MPRTRKTTPQVPFAEKIAVAQKVTGHEFADAELLAQALTHPSALDDRAAQARYERLEFLGDSVIGFLVAEEAFKRFPDMPEGGMTRIKISVVNGRVMSEVADAIGLGEAIVVGESITAAGGRGRRSVLENTFEALTAALYLDAGMAETRRWVLRTLGPLIDPACAESPENPKSALQEICQARGDSPAYRITGQVGPPHERSFSAEVMLNGEVIGTGEGRTKREAEAGAAEAALAHLKG
jgi:ribonuclease-3